MSLISFVLFEFITPAKQTSAEPLFRPEEDLTAKRCQNNSDCRRLGLSESEFKHARGESSEAEI